MLVNDIPVELSGVTRLTCQAVLREFPHNTSFHRMMNDSETTLYCNHELANSFDEEGERECKGKKEKSTNNKNLPVCFAHHSVLILGNTITPHPKTLTM